MKEEIIAQLAAHITQDILRDPGRALSADEPLISSGIIDSFNLVDLAVFIEEKFNVRIDDSELTADTFDTLTQLAELIKERSH